MVEKLKFIMGRIWDFLAPLIRILMSSVGPLLAELAMNAVKTVAETGLSNSEKRDAAFSMITDDLKKAGIEAATSTINALIEAAVIKLKADK